MIAFAHHDTAFDTSGESRMMPILVDYLRARRWLREDTVLVREFPVSGRRVDLATLTKSGVLSAFELKLDDFGRVLEQAVYNRQTFDRSWIVIGRTPRASSLSDASRFGIGVIAVIGDKAKVLGTPGPPSCNRTARDRSVVRLKLVGEMNV